MSAQPGEEKKEELPLLPVLPIRGSVLFPFHVFPLSVGRPGSLAAVDQAAGTEEKTLIVISQKSSGEDPAPDNLYRVGTRALIKKMVRSPNAAELLVVGAQRVEVVQFVSTGPALQARARVLPVPTDEGNEVEALFGMVLEQAQNLLAALRPDTPEKIGELLGQVQDALGLAYLIGTMMAMDVPKAQALLEAPTRLRALQIVQEHLAHELQVMEVRQKIAQRTATEMSEEQRKFVLRQQLRAIQDELGEKSPQQAELEDVRRRLGEGALPPIVRQEAARELEKLERLPPAAPDYQVSRSYLELILELPWQKATTDSLDLARVRQVLDEDHYDLQEIKARIVEHLAVMKLNPKANAPILCLVGPPGVGKTSVGQSIARAIGRKFERMSLGGLHDEAELRGHRRTYIGAMPGRILQAVRRAGVRNPLLMLDEVDKLGSDYRGDPSAALMEILDPAQNREFRDNYLDLPFDLSHVFFITTANTLSNIPGPLLDRMEVLRLSGYTQEEKATIAERYLIPRRIREAGLTPEQLQIPERTLQQIISRYTHEAGVRELERMLGRVARKAALDFAQERQEALVARVEDLGELLGPERFQPELARKNAPAGVVAGLAWTEAGGDIVYVEATLLREGEELVLTGSLGDVMKESARAAQSYVWSHAEELGISRAILQKSGIHIHLPSGAVPKDGPSAGITMATALASAYTGRPVPSDLAMTGELTLTGLVLPVGGIKEKVLAAHRAGMGRVILPAANRQDLKEVSPEVWVRMECLFVETLEEVLRVAGLLGAPEAGREAALGRSGRSAEPVAV